MPPASEQTIGRQCTIASRIDDEHPPSLCDGKTNRSEARSKRSISVRYPRSRTWCSNPRCRTCCSRSPRILPSPAQIKIASGNLSITLEHDAEQIGIAFGVNEAAGCQQKLGAGRQPKLVAQLESQGFAFLFARRTANLNAIRKNAELVRPRLEQGLERRHVVLRDCHPALPAAPCPGECFDVGRRHCPLGFPRTLKNDQRGHAEMGT